MINGIWSYVKNGLTEKIRSDLEIGGLLKIIIGTISPIYSRNLSLKIDNVKTKTIVIVIVVNGLFFSNQRQKLVSSFVSLVSSSFNRHSTNPSIFLILGELSRQVCSPCTAYLFPASIP